MKLLISLVVGFVVTVSAAKASQNVQMLYEPNATVSLCNGEPNCEITIHLDHREYPISPVFEVNYTFFLGQAARRQARTVKNVSVVGFVAREESRTGRSRDVFKLMDISNPANPNQER